MGPVRRFLILWWVLTGCLPGATDVVDFGSRGPGGSELDDDDVVDDDDASPDDDDASPGDDDDASPPPDFTAVETFSFELRVDVEPYDTVQGPLTFSPATLTLKTGYRDAGGVLLCRQQLELEGQVTQGVGAAEPACSECSARLSFDPTTVQDVSDLVGDPSGCPAGWGGLEAVGRKMVLPAGEGGFGDYLDLVFLHRDWLESSGWSAGRMAELSYVSLSEQYEAADRQFSGLLGTEAVAGSLASQASLGLTASPFGDDDRWLCQFALHEPINPLPSDLLHGSYRGTHLWSPAL